MNKYTIYCTEEQTKKALELGAPIEYVGYFDIGSQKAMIDFVGESGKMECAEFVIPIAEQMIGWLEEQDDIGIHIWRGKGYYGFSLWIADIEIKYFDDFQTRKEAILSAIDGALEYLEKYKTQ